MKKKIMGLLTGLMTVLCAFVISTSAHAEDVIQNVQVTYDPETITATMTWDPYENASATRYQIRMHNSSDTQVGSVQTPSLDKTSVTFGSAYFSVAGSDNNYTAEILAVDADNNIYARGTSGVFTVDFSTLSDPVAVTMNEYGVVSVTAPSGLPANTVVHYEVHVTAYVVADSANTPDVFTHDFSSALEAGTTYYAVASFYSSNSTSKIRDSRKVESAPVTYVGTPGTVSFNSGLGTGTMASVNVIKGSDYTLPACTFTPPAGNQFTYWEAGTKKLHAGDTTTITGDTEFYARYEVIPTHSVTATSLNVRKEPSTDSERIGGLKMGDTVVVVSTTEDGWSQINLGSGSYGYVQSKFLTAYDSSTGFTPASYVITASVVNVREGDSMDTPRLGGLSFGTVVKAVAKSGDWYKIEFGDGYGWVKGDYLAVCDGTGSYTPTYFQVGDTSVNVRESTTGSRIGGLSAGKVVLATGYVDGGSPETSWIIIDYNGKPGYVQRSLVSEYTAENAKVEEPISIPSGIPVSVPSKVTMLSLFTPITSSADETIYKLEEQDLTEIESGKVSFTICPGDAYTFPASLSKDDIHIDTDEYIVLELVKNADGSITVILEEIEDYTITSGAGSTWEKKDGTLTIRCDGALEKFTGVKVDGALIDPGCFTTESGSTILTLKSSYLETLSEGTHTLAMTYRNGQSDTIEFTVKKTQEGSGNKDTSSKDKDSKDNSSKDSKNSTGKTSGKKNKTDGGVSTGDSSNTMIWLILLLGSTAAFAGICEMRKRTTR